MIRSLRSTLLALPLAACVSTVSVREIEPELPEALVSVPARAWRVEEQGAHVGFCLRFDPSGGTHDSFHSVRNVWNQELGLVDAEGRFWRYRPHGAESLWLGTGTVTEGVFVILGLDPEASELIQTSLDDLASR